MGEEHENSPLLELNHCLCGRYECQFAGGEGALLAQDGFSACRCCQAKVSSCLPTGMYRGLSILLDTGVVQRWMDCHYPEFDMHIADLEERLCPNGGCLVARPQGSLRLALRQLYEKPPCRELPYYRAKMLELLVLLTQWRPLMDRCRAQEGKTLVMEEVRAQLGEDLQRELTLEKLARQNGICLTLLKREFQACYGLSPGAYRRHCRAEMAASLLAHTDMSVLEIALEVGYENASKFAAMFRREMGMPPAQYRKHRALLEHSGINSALLERTKEDKDAILS